MNKVKGNRSKFAFLTQTPLPKSSPHFSTSQKIIGKLVDAAKYQAANSFVSITLSEYRMHVLIWIHHMKSESLKLCEKSKEKPKFLLITAVNYVFNTAMDALNNYHRYTMKKANTFNENLFGNRSISKIKRTKSIKVNLQKTLAQYEDTVKRTRGIIRASLSFL